MKLFLTTIAAATLASAAALADDHRGNSDRAKDMRDNIQSSERGIASDLSGNRNSSKGDSGWGNIGSRETGGSDDAEVSRQGGTRGGGNDND